MGGRDYSHCFLISLEIWKGLLIKKWCQNYQRHQTYPLCSSTFFSPEGKLLQIKSCCVSRPLNRWRSPKNRLYMREEMRLSWLYLSPSRIIRCHGSANLNFLLLCEREREGRCKGENVFAWPLPFSEPNYSPASACYSRMRKKMHYCGPDGNIPHDQTNQSPWEDAGVTQPCSNTPFHSLSGTNTWSPINGTPRTREEGCFTTASLVHGWWLHNHTSILSKEKGDELPNNVSRHVNTNTVMDAALVGRWGR